MGTQDTNPLELFRVDPTGEPIGDTGEGHIDPVVIHLLWVGRVLQGIDKISSLFRSDLLTGVQDGLSLADMIEDV